MRRYPPYSFGESAVTTRHAPNIHTKRSNDTAHSRGRGLASSASADAVRSARGDTIQFHDRPFKSEARPACPNGLRPEQTPSLHLNTTTRTTKLQSEPLRASWLIAASTVAILLLTGCVRPSTPQGWSGGVVVENRLYVGSQDRDVRAIDTETGADIWQFDLRGDIESNRAVYGAPAVKDGVVYVGSYDGYLYALNTDTGQDAAWQERRVGDGSPIVGGPAVGDELVVIGSSDGGLYAFDAESGSFRWRFDTDNSIWASPAIVEGKIYFGSMDRNVYAVNLDGELIWKFPTGGAVTAAPLVMDGRVYVGSFSSVFYAIDAETGEEIWRFPGANNWYWSRAVANGGMLFVAAMDGRLYALDAGSGQLVWAIQTEAPIIGAPTLIDDWVAVASSNGVVQFVKQQGGGDSAQCNIRTPIKAHLAAEGRRVFFRAEDHTIRALEIKVTGNPDEVWVHRSNQEPPVQRDWTRSC